MLRLGAVAVTLLVFLSACSETSVDEVAGEWTLVSGTAPSGEIAMLDEYPITLSIEAEHGLAGGFGPCNHYGVLVLDDGEIREDENQGLAATAMGCGPPLEETETRYFEALNAATSFAIDGEQLVFAGPDTELRFERS